jgi:hypothetical protein
MDMSEKIMSEGYEKVLGRAEPAGDIGYVGGRAQSPLEHLRPGLGNALKATPLTLVQELRNRLHKTEMMIETNDAEGKRLAKTRADLLRAIVGIEPNTPQPNEAPSQQGDVPEGFTAWSGTSSDGPIYDVLLSDHVEVIYRNGDRYTARRYDFSWERSGGPYEVIAYRLLPQPEQSEAAGEGFGSLIEGPSDSNDAREGFGSLSADQPETPATPQPESSAGVSERQSRYPRADIRATWGEIIEELVPADASPVEDEYGFVYVEIDGKHYRVVEKQREYDWGAAKYEPRPESDTPVSRLFGNPTQADEADRSETTLQTEFVLEGEEGSPDADEGGWYPISADTTHIIIKHDTEFKCEDDRIRQRRVPQGEPLLELDLSKEHTRFTAWRPWKPALDWAPYYGLTPPSHAGYHLETMVRTSDGQNMYRYLPTEAATPHEPDVQSIADMSREEIDETFDSVGLKLGEPYSIDHEADTGLDVSGEGALVGLKQKVDA